MALQLLRRSLLLRLLRLLGAVQWRAQGQVREEVQGKVLGETLAMLLSDLCERDVRLQASSTLASYYLLRLKPWCRRMVCHRARCSQVKSS